MHPFSLTLVTDRSVGYKFFPQQLKLVSDTRIEHRIADPRREAPLKAAVETVLHLYFFTGISFELLHEPFLLLLVQRHRGAHLGANDAHLSRRPGV
jgi:hypothetical protein